jgi:hypothetical protein
MSAVVRAWFIGTALVLAAVLVWAFAPVLLFIALLSAGLGLVCLVMIGLARALERARGKARGRDQEPG